MKKEKVVLHEMLPAKHGCPKAKDKYLSVEEIKAVLDLANSSEVAAICKPGGKKTYMVQFLSNRGLPWNGQAAKALRN